MNSYTLNLKPLANKITVEHFEQLCQLNPELKLETNYQGELIIMSPTGYETGKNNADLLIQLGIWNRQNQLGIVCDSSTGFRRDDGSRLIGKRMDDANAILKWRSLGQR